MPGGCRCHAAGIRNDNKKRTKQTHQWWDNKHQVWSVETLIQIYPDHRCLGVTVASENPFCPQVYACSSVVMTESSTGSLVPRGRCSLGEGVEQWLLNPSWLMSIWGIILLLIDWGLVHNPIEESYYKPTRIQWNETGILNTAQLNKEKKIHWMSGHYFRLFPDRHVVYYNLFLFGRA